MLDFQLAELYQVETRALKQAVRRNIERFPADFMFELSVDEIEDLVSQNVIPGLGKLGGAIPMAFTEQGVSMLSSVLRGKRAVEVNITIMRAFVRLRELLASNADLFRKWSKSKKSMTVSSESFSTRSANSWHPQPRPSVKWAFTRSPNRNPFVNRIPRETEPFISLTYSTR